MMFLVCKSKFNIFEIIISGVTLPTNIANMCCNPNGIACVKLGLPSN